MRWLPHGSLMDSALVFYIQIKTSECLIHSPQISYKISYERKCDTYKQRALCICGYNNNNNEMMDLTLNVNNNKNTNNNKQRNISRMSIVYVQHDVCVSQHSYLQGPSSVKSLALRTSDGFRKEKWGCYCLEWNIPSSIDLDLASTAWMVNSSLLILEKQEQSEAVNRRMSGWTLVVIQ